MKDIILVFSTCLNYKPSHVQCTTNVSVARMENEKYVYIEMDSPLVSIAVYCDHTA